ncbi:MAG: DUF3089 domain-containing protein [Cellvibrionaceae bacterium]
MKRVIKVFSAVLALGILAGIGLYSFGDKAVIQGKIFYWMNHPELPFEANEAGEAPNYAERSSWAALPGMVDSSDMLPDGVSDAKLNGEAPVDVFYIHPTGFFNQSDWVFSLDSNTGTEENTRFFMANQAGIFSGCCNVYAPRFRQANVFAFLAHEELKQEILEFAYQDVETAFQYYLKHYNNGRPFIIAGHSQGAYHGMALLERVINGSSISKNMVAAYIIGGKGSAARVSNINDMADIDICQKADDVNCLIHFDMYSYEAADRTFPDNVCVNPLSWVANTDLAGKEKHIGGVLPTGEFQVVIKGDDTPSGKAMPPLGSPITKAVTAQCKDGVLRITGLENTAFSAYQSQLEKGSYHAIEYNLFYMDIRENAKTRVAKFLAL